MKTRIASSLALAAALLLGASGCAMFAPQGTVDSYAPSDGIDLNVGDLAVRNLMLIPTMDGEQFNVVFTAVNEGASSVPMTIDFVSDDGSAEASADFVVEPGTQLFGDPEGDVEPTLVSIPDLKAGQTVTAYFQVLGSTDVERQAPVIDGTLFPEYEVFVIAGPITVTPQGLDDQSEGADEQGVEAEDQSTEAE